MGAPIALAYDANASAILVATIDAPFAVAVTLASDMASFMAWSLSLEVGGVSPVCRPTGIAFNNASGTLYASGACGVANHAIYSASCTLPTSGLDPASTQTPSPTAMPTSTPSVAPAAASPSTTPSQSASSPSSLAGAVQSEQLCYRTLLHVRSGGQYCLFGADCRCIQCHTALSLHFGSACIMPLLPPAGLPIALCSPSNATTTIVAGIGLAGMSGDGGLASAAALASPSGLLTDRGALW